ncbi:SAM-dependent methyltransferase [Catenulispora yoronensis]|uniref:SAM-dependent methyltransferase n=1 Tax=Catenulispora yoronensis TaxID=450799 RepID=A0ABP5GFV1_9ACTN
MTDAIPPVQLQTDRPNMARMYDYALGGKNNFAADRAAVERLFSLSPENKYVPLANRRFLGRAVDFAARQGITQYLDLGAGLPSMGNVHEVAKLVRPEARVAYVDNDPVVAAHARALLTSADATVRVVQEDVRDPAKVLGHPDVVQLIDFGRPVAVLLVSLLHGITDEEDPAGLVRAFTEVTAPGSYLILSHLTRDGHPADIVHSKEEVFARSNTVFRYRARAEIEAYFAGFDLVEPGLTPVTDWRSEGTEESAADADPDLAAAGSWWLGGVALKAG